jgi:hypothetical protein
LSAPTFAAALAHPTETRKGDMIQADHGPYGSVSRYFT